MQAIITSRAAKLTTSALSVALSNLLSFRRSQNRKSDFGPRKVFKRGICYENILSLRLSVCHTRDQCLNASRYQNVLYLTT